MSHYRVIRPVNCFHCCLGAELLILYKTSLENLEKRQRELALAEKLFDLPITMYIKLVKAQKELSDLSKIYQLLKEFSVSYYLIATATLIVSDNWCYCLTWNRMVKVYCTV